jgi:hypothetical protein
MFWFTNDRSGRYKLVDKIDKLLTRVDVQCRPMDNVWKVYKLQCLSFMHDLSNNIFSVPCFPLVTNNMVHSHFTRASCNVHIQPVGSLEKRNFIYNCTLHWNRCSANARLLSKCSFNKYCRMLL